MDFPDSATDGSRGYFCRACGTTYPMIGDVVDFLPGGLDAKGRGQKLMESTRIVDIYEGKWWRDSGLFAWLTGTTLAEEISRILHITGPGQTDTILDLACGTGLYARAFALGGTGRTVFGLDASWPMLKYATDKARRMGIKNVRFMHGDAHNLPFADGSLDIAICCGALHLFPDVKRVLGELHRAIKPGGRLAIATAWKSDDLGGRMKAYADMKLWKVHHFSREELGSLLGDAGFDPTIYHTYRVWMIAGGVRR